MQWVDLGEVAPLECMEVRVVADTQVEVRALATPTVVEAVHLIQELIK
jgi:hypothetical protein